jgi:hypothetical protein
MIGKVGMGCADGDSNIGRYLRYIKRVLSNGAQMIDI